MSRVLPAGLFLTVVAVAAIGAIASGGAALAAPGGQSTFRADLTGEETGAAGEGTASIELDRAKKKLCYAIETEGAEKGRVFLGKGAKGDDGRLVLTLFSRNAEKPRLKGCVKRVPTSLINDIAGAPKDYFVAAASSEFPDGALRGQLRPGAPGAGSGYSATDCYIYLDDDTGEGHDFATGQDTTKTPINGQGVRYLATEDHSITTCIAQRTYTFPQGTIKVYAKDRLIGSNVYSCTATGIYKCFGPREGSTTSGYTLSVIYYACIPGAWPPAYYCPR